MDDVDQVIELQRQYLRGMIWSIIGSCTLAFGLLYLRGLLHYGPSAIIGADAVDGLDVLEAAFADSSSAADLLPSTPIALVALALSLFIATTLTRGPAFAVSQEDSALTTMAQLVTAIAGFAISSGSMALAIAGWKGAGAAAGAITVGTALLSACLVGLSRPPTVLQLLVEHRHIERRRARLYAWRTSLRPGTPAPSRGEELRTKARKIARHLLAVVAYAGLTWALIWTFGIVGGTASAGFVILLTCWWARLVNRLLPRLTAHHKVGLRAESAGWIVNTLLSTVTASCIFAAAFSDQFRNMTQLAIFLATPFAVWLGPILYWQIGRKAGLANSSLIHAADELDGQLANAESAVRQRMTTRARFPPV